MYVDESLRIMEDKAGELFVYARSVIRSAFVRVLDINLRQHAVLYEYSSSCAPPGTESFACCASSLEDSDYPPRRTFPTKLR